MVKFHKFRLYKETFNEDENAEETCFLATNPELQQFTEHQEYKNLFTAIKDNDLTYFKSQLLLNKFELDEIIDGETLLCRAVKQGRTEIVKLLLMSGADVNKTDGHLFTPLHYGVHKRYQEIVELLLKRNANSLLPAKDGNTPLHYAAVRLYDATMLEILLAHCDSVTVTNNEGDTPLQTVAMDKDYGDFVYKTKNYNKFMLFIKHIAERKCVDTSVIAVLKQVDEIFLYHAACYIPETVAYVKGIINDWKSPTNLNERDPQNNKTPLQRSVELGIPAIVEFLMKNGADVTMLSSDGQPILQHALEKASRMKVINEKKKSSDKGCVEQYEEEAIEGRTNGVLEVFSKYGVTV